MTYLDDAESYLQSGDVRRARRALERARGRALVAGDAAQLERILALAEALAERDPSARTKRLIDATTQNLRFVQWAGTGAEQAPPPVTAKQSRFESALNAVDVTARMLENEIRNAITLAEAALAPPTPAPVPAPVPTPVAAPLPPEPPPAPPPPPRPAKPRKPPRQIDWSLFLGARGLALAGGLVTILGIVFFFILAANRGWLTPEIRIGLGTFTSVAVFSAGLWVKSRYGRLQAALAAVSAGIAGGYATLLAATALYDFVPQLAALVIAAAIAAVGAAVSLAWSAQTVAGLGLVGAILVPLMVLVDEGELSFVGTCFVAIVFAGTALVALRKRWRELLMFAGAASLVQIALLVAETHALEWRLVALSAVFWLLYLGVGLAWQRRFGTQGLEPVAGTAIITGGALATYACAYLLSGTTLGVHREGIGLLVVSAVYGALAIGFFRQGRTRDVTSLLWAIAAILGAVAGGELFAGPSLTAVWGAVAVLLAWLAARTGEQRLLLPAFGYLVLALGYVFAVEGPPVDLFEASPHPAAGAASAAFAAAALLLFGRFAAVRPQSVEETGTFARYLGVGVAKVRALGPVYFWGAGALLLYSTSLALLELFVQVDTFDDGHVALAALWAGIAFALVETGLRLPRLDLQTGGFALLAFAVGEGLFYDVDQLSTTVWSLSFLALALGALLVGFEYGRLASVRERLLPAGAAILTSACLGAAAVVALAHGQWQGFSSEGAALLGLALVYAGFSLPVFRSQRDLSTLLWALALALAIAGGAELWAGRWLVLAGALLCAGLAALAWRTRELRLQGASALVFSLSLAYALWTEAPPRELFVAVAHPGAGVPALLFLAGAAGVFAVSALSGRPRVHLSTREPVSASQLLDWLAGEQAMWRATSIWLSGVLLLYAASLAVLELFVRVASFEWGHVGLAGLWAAIAYGLVETGLRLPRIDLQAGAFGLLAFAVAAALLYDLDQLSTTVWSLSFLALALGALLVGFEYGRLASVRERLLPAGAAILTSACLGAAAVVALAHGQWQGFSSEGAALLGLALVYAGFSLPVFRSQRDLSTLLWALALALAIAGGAELWAGRWLVLAGALLCAGLAALAWRTRELRLQGASALVFSLSLAYALWTEAPPRELFVAVAHPGAGVPALLFLAGAAGVFAVTARASARAAAIWAAGALTLYAASLSVLELFVAAATFDYGHIALSGLWSLTAVALVEWGVRRDRPEVALGGFTLLAGSIVEALVFDSLELPRIVWGPVFFAVALGALLVGFEYGRLASVRERLLPAGAAILTSACLGAAAVVALAHGQWQGFSSEGAALLGLALVYAGFSLPVFRSQRDLSTLLWALALALAIAGGAELWAGRWLVLAGALLCAGLAALAWRTRELRLQGASALVFSLSLAYALWTEAPPRELFVAVAHPGAGVPALLFLAGAAAVFAYGPELRRHARAWTFGVLGVLLFYAVSLSILEIAEIATNADVDTKFQRGHTGVSAFWGLISLGLLYFGLTRRSRALRLAGFGLFGVTLVKIFLYDLAFLSSLTRALSFIAVGGVLLFAGFFYQRVSEQLEERDHADSPGAPPGNAPA